MSDGNRHDEIQGEIIHVYDGIEEADNELPLWWLFTFYGAIIFAICYWFYFEGFQVGDSPMQAYAAELAASAAAGGEVSDELIEAMAMDPSAVGTGREVFLAQCAVCHREDAGGNIGPNLTDPNWIHGGSASNIHNTIRDGVTTAAMPAWGAVLGPVAVQQVAAFVVSLRNSNVEGKEPQGDVWTPGAGASVDAEAAPEAPEEGDEDDGSEATPTNDGADAEPATPDGEAAAPDGEAAAPDAAAATEE